MEGYAQIAVVLEKAAESLFSPMNCRGRAMGFVLADGPS